MKILMTTDTIGGVWTYSLELCRALGALGARVALAAMGGPPTSEQRAQAARLRNVELYESDFRLEWMDDPWADVEEAGRWLLALERSLLPDVIHVNGYAHAALAWRAPVLAVGHSCVLSWWQAVRHEPAPESWDAYRFHVRKGLDSADFVVAPSAAMMEELQRYYGPLYRTRVIHNARDPKALFEPATKEPFIFAAGRLWDEAKNLSALCEAAGRLPWPVYLAGQERRPGAAEPAAGVNPRCLGHLPQETVASWLNRAAIYALPARYEPFGLSVLEAALSGCSLVLGDIKSLREIWGDSAIYVSPENSAELEQVLRALIADSGLRIELAIRARKHAAQYAPARMGRDYFALYRQIRAARMMEGAQKAAQAPPVLAVPSQAGVFAGARRLLRHG